MAAIGEAEPGEHALQRDRPRPPGDADRQRQTVDAVDEQHDNGAFGGGGRAARPHGDADAGAGERRGRR